MDYLEEQKRKTNPVLRASIITKVLFLYTIRIFRRGFKKDFGEDDLFEVLPNFSSKFLGDQLEREWEKQKENRQTNSIFRLLWSCYGWSYLAIGVSLLMVKLTIIVLQPKALSKLIAYFVPGQTELTRSDACFYAGIVIGLNFFNCVYNHNYHLCMTNYGIRIRTAFCSFIYRKTLKLSPERLGDISIGKVITLMTKDVHAFDIFLHLANDLWVGVVKTLVMYYMIYDRIGLATLAGTSFFLIVMPLQAYLGTLSAKLRMRMCQNSDARLQVTQETLSAIRIVKMYTWEKFFNEKISKARKKELNSLLGIIYLKYVILAMGFLNGNISFYLLIMTYIWLGNDVTAELVYYVLSCYQTLSHTLSVLVPMAVMYSAELFASMKRIGNVLEALEIDAEPQNAEATLKPKIILKNVSTKMKDREILHDISLNINTGTTLIAGPVGSGKSFLLKTILQDFAPTSGHLETRGRISYASQEPWLFPSSIRQNILFGESYEEKRYQDVLAVCALQYDLELLESGDSTIVEDRGTNLSKGQQARINLARAVYKDCDIYLLDDCLSALDAHVSDYIFKKCIRNFLKDKLVVLVTHNTNHLDEVDTVVILVDGNIMSSSKVSGLSLQNLQESVDGKGNDLDVVKAATCKVTWDSDEPNEDTVLVTETTTERKVYHEMKKEGEVDMAVYKKYIKFGGGWFILAIVFLVFIAAQFAISYTDKLVSKWVNVEEELSNYSVHSMNTNTSDYFETVSERNGLLNLYSIMVILATVLTLSRALAMFTFGRKASIRLHKYMIANIINATMYFFDSNFIGNILNRFSKDLGTIDDMIPWILYHVFTVALNLIGIAVLIATVNIMFLIPTFIFLMVLVMARRLYIPTGRSLKRLNATTRSPVIGHLNATLEGLSTIRAFKAEEILRDEFDRHQDLFTSATYLMETCMRAFGFFLDFLCSCFISVIVVRFLVADQDTLAGNVGLAITQAFTMSGTLQWGVRQWAEIENQMTAVERVLEYTEVEQENKQGLVLENWPEKAEIVYKTVSLTYPNTSEAVLRNITFKIRPNEKIGIVGRTGAGKSSIISTLFRLYDVEGDILVDGVNIKTLSLPFLRSHISIIPQDPVLFTGTIRNNIDPTETYNDEEIWQAIKTASLKPLIPSLDFEITENGSNFSVGQRQLICLARAVVLKNRIIVLDEATANMDHTTDNLIHETIRESFQACTVITIAHKLVSILKSDRIMVMDKGEIVEFDEPSVLLANQNGIFYRMVEKAGLL